MVKVEDCAGECSGTATNDECCISDGGVPMPDGTCCSSGIVDCNGDCNGSAIVDDCGECGGDGSSCATETVDVLYDLDSDLYGLHLQLQVQLLLVQVAD